MKTDEEFNEYSRHAPLMGKSAKFRELWKQLVGGDFNHPLAGLITEFPSMNEKCCYCNVVIPREQIWTFLHSPDCILVQVRSEYERIYECTNKTMKAISYGAGGKIKQDKDGVWIESREGKRLFDVDQDTFNDLKRRGLI